MNVNVNDKVISRHGVKESAVTVKNDRCYNVFLVKVFEWAFVVWVSLHDVENARQRKNMVE